MKRFALLIAFPVLGASAQAVVVDDFTVAYANSVQTGTYVDFQAGSMIGGERDIQFEVLTNPFNSFCDLFISGSGMAVTSQGFGMLSSIYLQYDRTADELGNSGAGNVLMNGGTGGALIGGSNDRVRITWIGNDLDVTVTATARLSGGVLESQSGLRPGGSGPGAMDIFLAPANLAAADSLTFQFSGVTNADFAISKLEVVPEPATLLVLAAGAGLAARRRRSQR